MREISLTRCGDDGSGTNESCEAWEEKGWIFWGLGLKRKWKRVCKILGLEDRDRDLVVAIL